MEHCTFYTWIVKRIRGQQHIESGNVATCLVCIGRFRLLCTCRVLAMGECIYTFFFLYYCTMAWINSHRLNAHKNTYCSLMVMLLMLCRRRRRRRSVNVLVEIVIAPPPPPPPEPRHKDSNLDRVALGRCNDDDDDGDTRYVWMQRDYTFSYSYYVY